MNNVKSSTVGIDIPIQKFQVYLYSKIKVLWNLSDTTLEAYGRVYKNTNDKGFIPEVFVPGLVQSNNTQYKAAYFDETTYSAMYFFNVEGVTRFNAGQEVDKVSLIIIVNLEQVKPLLSHRGDEEVRIDIERICTVGRYNFLLTGTETGYANVFKGFTGILDKDNQIYRDRHPLFCLKMNFDVNYDPTAIECITPTI